MSARKGLLWINAMDASRDDMLMAFAYERDRIAKQCHQLRMDVDSYNDNRNPGDPVVLVMDFTRDVADREALRILKKQAGTP